MEKTAAKSRTTTIPDNVREKIAEAIRGTAFGEVVVTVHNSRIVQIEKKEKIRFGKQ